MTLDDIAKMENETLTPLQASELLKCNPQYIRMQARKDPEKLGFPVICVRKRVYIPRRPFLKFMGWTGQT